MEECLPFVVIYEDRLNAVPGVELLARSLHRYSPSLTLLVFSPLREIADRLRDLSTIKWVETHDLVGQGWNAKPEILTRGLEIASRVLWLDSDIVMIGDVTSHLAGFAPGTLVVGQEFRGRATIGSQLRAEGFGFQFERDLPYAVNSGSILADRSHLNLLSDWRTLLVRKDYRAAQILPVEHRPAAFVGDQDALWALLASGTYRSMPLDYFRIGRDMIIHCGANGYHTLDRIKDIKGSQAAFVHMLGRYKPWSFVSNASLIKQRNDYFHQLCFELSPYFEGSRPFSQVLGDPPWLKRRTAAARILHVLAGRNWAVQGLPLAMIAWFASMAGRKAGR